MSFPKAKIHRFNEEMTCAPPPGKYDPKFDNKVKGAVIEKSKRFVEPKLSSASSTESIDSIGRSTSNLSVLPVFRTPKLKRNPLKTPKSVPVHHMTGSGSTLNARRNLENDATSSNKLDNQTFALQLQEKDVLIKKLNEELAKLQMTLSEEQVRIDEERKIAERFHNDEIESLNNEMNALKLKIDEDQEKHLAELVKIVSETKAQIQADNDKVRTIETEFDIYRMEMEVDFKVKLNEVCEEMKSEIETLTKKLQATVDRVSEMDSEFSKKTEDYDKLTKEIEEKLEKSLTDLLTISAIKDELQGTNSKQNMALEESERRIHNLETQLSVLEVELARSKQTCKTFHVTTLEHRKTIEALSKRLFESESEVERLNSVQSDLENQKILLEGKAENLIMEIINLRESMKFMESEIIRDVEEIKCQLTAKVDSYRIKAAEETKSLLETVEEKQRTIDMLVNEIDYYRNRLNETEGYVNSIKIKSEEYSGEIAQLKVKLVETEEEFSEKMNVQKNVYSILDDNYKEKCELLKKLQQLNADQEQHINELMEKLDHQSECAQRATAQINNLTTDNLTKEKQIENLVSKLESSGECVKTISKRFENMVQQLSDKDKQINMLHQELELKLAALVSVTSENDDMKYTLEQKMHHIEELEKEIRETHKDNEKYVDELISEIVLEKERGSELSSLISQIEDDKMKFEDDLKNTQMENEELLCKNSTLKDELLKLHIDVESEKEKSIRLTELLAEHEDNKHVLEERLEKDSIEKAQLILELSTKIDNLEELLKKTEEMKMSAEHSNEELKMNLNFAQEHINDLEGINESTKLKVEELSERIENMSAQLVNETNEKELLQSEADMCKFEEVVASLKEEIVLLCDNIDSKEMLVSQLTEMKSGLETQLTKSTEEYERQINKLKEQIQRETEKNNDLNNSYLKMENRKNEYKLYSCKITEEVEQLKEDLQKLQDEKSKLESEKNQLEIMIGPFMKQLRDYEEERNSLASKKGAVEEELYALERKYAQSLGHQNLKQRIHYVSRLKEESIQYKQTIEQLTSENARLKSKCKDLEIASRENNSPIAGKKSINREKIHSPNVLKDRNQQ